MSLWKIAWRSIQQRGLASVLTTLSMALGVMMVVAVLLIHGIVSESFKSNSSLGYNMIVGAKGGKLQLVLNTVYFLSEPIENIPYSYYLEFLTSEELAQLQKQGIHSQKEIDELREARRAALTRLRVEQLAGRWWNWRMDEPTRQQIMHTWWLRQPAAERQKWAEKFYGRMKKDRRQQIDAKTFAKYAASDFSQPVPKSFSKEIDDLLHSRLKPQFLELVVAWWKNELNDEQRADLEKFNLPAKLPVLLDADLLDGRFARQSDDHTPNLAIPFCLGDYYKTFRLVGTSPKLFTDLEYRFDEKKKYEFDQGGPFKPWDEKYGYFGAVVGSHVARQHNLKLGDQVYPSHGVAEGEREGSIHKESGFTVVGILAPSGTPMDRAVFINMEGFYLMEGHAKPQLVEGEEVPSATPSGNSSASGGPRRDALPMKEREITSVLLRTDALRSMPIRNDVNEANIAQAVFPISEITGLFDMIVRPVQMVLLAITMLICVVSGVSILVSIYNSMNDRKHEIAVMRALGAGRSTVMAIVLLESVFLSLMGGALGWLIGHAAVFAAGPYVEELTGVRLGFFDFAPPSPDIFTLMLTVFGWLLIGTGIVVAVVAWLWAAFLTFRDRRSWALSILIPPLFVVLPLIWCLGKWNEGRTWLAAMVFGLLFSFVGIGLVYLAGQGLFLPAGEAIPPELVLIPALVLLAIIVGFMPAITAYRTDVAKSLQ